MHNLLDMVLYESTEEEKYTNKKEKKIMRKWTKETAIKTLTVAGCAIDLEFRVISLKGKGTMTLCSAADYLTKAYSFIQY